LRSVLRGAREAFARCGMLAFAGVYECGDARGVGREVLVDSLVGDGVRADGESERDGRVMDR